jgi:glutamyl-tRNA synthetase
MSQVRVRFAPSPTGFFHIGSARTALFNWLYARHTGGVFILRVEDTDQARNSEAFLNLIYESLRWLGLDWDEGPQAGGAFGPYRQSERGEIYRAYLERLKATGRTYEKEGAVFFKVSGQPQRITDAIRGQVERLEEKDFVIVRSDGNPVFHFVNVVDDIAMEVTHVIRGEDHLSNTSKHTELFHAFGAPVPVYAHIPLILKQNGPGKMSKRDQGALIEEYQRRGFLPEALVNFLCLLGWSPKDDQETLPIAEIIRRFDLPGINQSNARFDERKLAHMNMGYLHALAPERYAAFAGEYLRRQNFFGRGGGKTGAATEAGSFGGVGAGAGQGQGQGQAEDQGQRAGSPMPDEGYLREVLMLCQPKVRAVEDLPKFIGYFFGEDFPIEEAARWKIFAKGDPKARLGELRTALATADFGSDAALEATVQALAAAHGVGTGDYIHPGRLAVSGMSVGPSFYGLYRVLGRERVLARIDRMLAVT